MFHKDTRRGPLYFLLVAMCISQIGVGIIIPVLPQFMQQEGISAGELGWLVALLGFTQFLVSPLAGRMVDQRGRKELLLLGLGLFSAASFFFAYADGMPGRYISRIIGGIGLACMNPALAAYVVDVTAEVDRLRGISWLGAAMTVGIVIGPGIGGLLALYGVKVPFYAAALLAAVAMLVAASCLPETGRPPVAGLAAQNDGIYTQLVWSLRSRYAVLFMLIFIFTFGMTAVEAVYGLYAARRYLLAPEHIAIYITAGAVVSAIIQAACLDRWVKNGREKTILQLCLLVSAVSLVAMIFTANEYWLFVISLCFFAGISAFRPVINVLLAEHAGEQQGFIAGIANAYTSLGVISGPLVGGWLFDQHIDLPYWLGAMMLVASLLFTINWKKDEVVVV